jgi:hypothetical protein
LIVLIVFLFLFFILIFFKKIKGKNRFFNPEELNILNFTNSYIYYCDNGEDSFKGNSVFTTSFLKILKEKENNDLLIEEFFIRIKNSLETNNVKCVKNLI